MKAQRTGASHEPPLYDETTMYAVRAFAEGTASAGQQIRAWNWILRDVAGYADVSFRPGGMEGDRATAFAEGRRFVAVQLLKMLQPELNPKPEGE